MFDGDDDGDDNGDIKMHEEHRCGNCHRVMYECPTCGHDTYCAFCNDCEWCRDKGIETPIGDPPT